MIVFAIILFGGYGVNIHAIEVVYYLLCSIAFLTGYALTVSAITVVFKDFSKLMSSVIRLLFYVTPVVWSFDRLPERIAWILRLNPLAYIIEGYRNSILYGVSLLENWQYMCYFWAVTLILFVLGCNVHMKFRKQFIDLI